MDLEVLQFPHPDLCLQLVLEAARSAVEATRVYFMKVPHCVKNAKRPKNDMLMWSVWGSF